MGYIKDLGEEVRAKLESFGLDEESMAEILKFVKDKIIESYKNGIKTCQMLR